MFKNHTLLSWLTEASIFCATFFLPLKTGLSNAGLIGLLATTLVAFIRYGVLSVGERPIWGYLKLPWLLFLPLLIGAFYTQYPENLTGQLSKMIFYLLVPLVLFRKDLNKNRSIEVAATGLLLGAAVSSVYLLTFNFLEFSEAGTPIRRLLSYSYTGKKFVSPLPEMHQVYLGSYYLFALVLLWQSKIKAFPLLKWAGTLLLLTAILFVNSRSILALTALFGVTIVYRILGRNYVLGLIAVAIALFFLATPFLKDTYVYKKFSDGTLWEFKENIGTHNTDDEINSDSRMSRWIASWEIYKERPLLGYGTGSARELLLQSYAEKGMQVSLRQQYDSHNQFLAYAIEFGAPGIAAILCFFVANLWVAWRRPDALLGFFIVMILVICLTENYLIRNMGINFVALWTTILHLKKDD